jgi:hypothetical protein
VSVIIRFLTVALISIKFGMTAGDLHAVGSENA